MVGLPGVVAAATPVSIGTVVLAGAIAGFAGAVVMDVPMVRQQEGFTPAYVAASVLRGTDPESVPIRDASLVHHAAGVLAGVLYAVLATAAAAVLGVDPTPGGLAGAILPHALAVVFVVGFIYAFFAHVVLPRAGRGIYEERATAVRGQWLRSSLVFGVTLALVAPALLTLLA